MSEEKEKRSLGEIERGRRKFKRWCYMWHVREPEGKLQDHKHKKKN